MRSAPAADLGDELAGPLESRLLIEGVGHVARRHVDSERADEVADHVQADREPDVPDPLTGLREDRGERVRITGRAALYMEGSIRV